VPPKPGGSIRSTGGDSASPLLERRQTALVLFDTIAQGSILTQEVADLAHGGAHGDELRREAHLGLGLATA
jgi:hypothetical protein